MRQPRAKRAPRAPRVRVRRGSTKGIGIWNAVCRDCKTKFRILHGPKPKHCIACKSKKLDINPGRINAQERAERDARFVHAASHFLFMVMDMFGIEVGFIPPPAARPAMSREEAARFIGTYALDGVNVWRDREIIEDPVARAEAYKRAARKLHPDTGGSHELFVKLQQAKAVLDR